MTPLVSIIIPVYKVEKYIVKCMQSLLDQTYENFEALVVDDGSPDNSITLAKELVGDDPRFIFLEKENGGQGSARNLGLDHARGDYIAFLDSDDSYTADMLQVVVDEFAKEDDIDVLTFGINFVDENGVLTLKESPNTLYFTTSKDVLLLHRTTSNYFWDKVYKRDVLKHHRFSSFVKTYEDVDLMYQVLYGCKLKSIPNCLYNYTNRIGSTTNSVPLSFVDDKKRIVKNARDFLKQNKLNHMLQDYFTTYYLVEMYGIPLFTLSWHSKDFKSYKINAQKLRKTDMSLISLKNLKELKGVSSFKRVLVVYSFKYNANLPYIIISANRAIKNKLRKLKVS